MKKLFEVVLVVVTMAVGILPAVALEETWKHGAIVWMADHESPVFEITGIYATPGRIEIRNIYGYYDQNKMEIMGISWSDEKKAFLITFRLKDRGGTVRAFFLDLRLTDFIQYAKRKAELAYPDVAIGDHPTVVWEGDTLNVMSLYLEPYFESLVKD